MVYMFGIKDVKMYKGITIGKFMPLSVGHELMIEFGASMLAELCVVVGGKETDIIPLSTRVAWVREFTNKFDNVYVIAHDESDAPETTYDKEGTAENPAYLRYWVRAFNHYLPDATHFMTTDMYGKKVAELMGVEWLPVDPERLIVNISATEIRNNILTRFNKISTVAKPYFVKTVAIVGPESCGKSTIVKKLANLNLITGVPEYGRTISSNKIELTEKDFWTITKGQSLLINIAKRGHKPIVVSDTEAFTTYLYGKTYLGKKLSAIKEVAIRQNFDMYIVLAPTVPWINDGTRVQTPEERTKFFNEMVSFLQEYKKPYIVVNDIDYEDRYTKVDKIIWDLL